MRRLYQATLFGLAALVAPFETEAMYFGDNATPYVDNRFTKYTIKPNDTLWDIAGIIIGDKERWEDIAIHNGITDPRKLKVGLTIEIPTKKYLEELTQKVRIERACILY